jgi:hypothetical protein
VLYSSRAVAPKGAPLAARRAIMLPDLHRTPPAALLVVLAALVGGCGDSGDSRYAGPVRAVERGPLTISVSEAGAIEAREKVVLKCEVDERSTTITYIVEEGTRVQ